MAVPPGTRLGVYEIVALLGAGGMGEVYRARDTRLDRTVAIKVLPQHLAADAEFRERFDREARAISQLDHPHICALYDVGAHEGLSFLVMQYLEGETLQARLERGLLDVKDALAIAIQIASALDAAHRARIVHRDLKPGNIFLVRGGASGSPAARLLDFGLAKTADARTPGGSTLLPTTPANLTAQGTLLGTFQYMAPEQLEGCDADARTDIFAFGAVVYEMVAGRKAFEGKSQASLIAKILESDPPSMSSLQPMTPPALDRIVKKCLAKNPDARWQSAADLATELQWVSEPLTAVGLGSAASSTTRSLVWLWATLAIIASALAAIAGVGWWRATRPIERPLIRMSAALIAGQRMSSGTSYEIDGTLLANHVPGTSLALSPDGSRLVATTLGSDGRQRLAVRRLDQDRFDPLPGSEDATAPFFSPDGEWIAFFANGKLKKMPVEGGSPATLCDAGNFPSGSWGEDGTIVVALGLNEPLSRVPSAGGAPTAVTKLENGETVHERPQVLPGGASVLFTARTGVGAENARIDVMSLRTHERKTVIRGGEIGRYVQSSGGRGYLIYLGGQTLFAAPFDLASGTVTGTAKRIVGDVSTIHSTRGEFDVSQTGTFVYIGGPEDPERSIFWLDQTGRTEPLHAESGFYSGLRFSPDGTRLVFVRSAAWRGQSDLWVQDLQRGTVDRLTSLPGFNISPVWSPDGGHIMFSQGSQGASAGEYWVRSDGAGQPQKLDGTAGYPISFSPDGKLVALINGNPFTAMQISVASLEGPPDQPRLGSVKAIASVRGFPMPVFSADGRWIAYASGETGKSQIYVEPFPGPGGKVSISIDGGTFPAWSPNGRELFFLDPSRRIMVVDYTTRAGQFVAGQPRLWSPHPILLTMGGGPFQPYALAPNGKRFAVMLYPDGSAESRRPLHLTFLLNFADELRRQVGR
jgi:eukaryotic-like serine/threonine-protein kinase